ncbi:MAG: sulfur carrier protein ThiS [Candidatus Dormibacteraceae bacterium]
MLEAELITILLNGESKEVPQSLTVQALLEWLNLPQDRVAVERNLEILPRHRWRDTLVEDGDRLEVVHFVGGGAPGRCLLGVIPRC